MASPRRYRPFDPPVATRVGRHLSRFFAALLVVVFSIFGSVGPSSADSTFVDGPPDKGLHTWCYLSGFTMQTQADASMTRLRAQTVVDTAYYNPCGASTDVRWRQGSLSGGAFGMAECTVWWANGQCDRYQVTLNKTAINDTDYPTSQGHKTACHELGHTAGVSHYSGSSFPGNDTTHSCMRSGTVTGQSWNTLYGNHHKVSHINPWFS